MENFIYANPIKVTETLTELDKYKPLFTFDNPDEIRKIKEFTQTPDLYASTGRPITLVLDNARYQKCQSVADKVKELGIELLYLPPYSPNLNLIERLWGVVKKQVLYSTHYDKYDAFRDSIDGCIAELATRYKANMRSLVTMNFQLFSTKTENSTI
jgi:transposase